MEITTGRIVLYKLTEQDAAEINRRRTTGGSISERIKNNGMELSQATNIPDTWPLGTQAHIGNSATAGEQYPMVVTRVWSPGCVNGQVLLDGNDCFWATSVSEGTGERSWSWPPRV